MKEITYKIINSLKHFPPIPGSHLSQRSKTFLTKIFRLFVEGQKTFPSVKINSTNAANCKDDVDDYIPIEIKDSINKKRKHKTELIFHVRDRKIILSMYHFENISTALLNQHINRVYLWLYVASQFAPSKCSRTLNINIYFTDAKKRLPLKKQPLQSIHANTAFTTSCSIETEINIFRQEEWFKVLIHETFHCLGLDFSDSKRDGANARILTIFPVKSDVRLFETYCEIWAETINVMFIAFFSTRNNNITKMLEKTENMMHYERMFSLLQCTKVLKHFHLTYDELYKKDALSHSKRKENYKEETQILSYYILKCIYMFHLNEYLEWCLSNNGETLNFHKTQENIEGYIVLLESLYARPEFLSAMRQYEKIAPSTLANTLRMSVFELV